MTTPLSIGQRVEINNLEAAGAPGPYHGCRAFITRLFDHDGQPAARVQFTTGVEKNILASKLVPVEVKPAAPAERSESSKPVPAWAVGGCRWVLGSELRAGDTVYFSHIANPRVLVNHVSAGNWRGAVVINRYGYTHRIEHQEIVIDTTRWYVVKAVA